jgi:hypothetical protein
VFQMENLACTAPVYSAQVTVDMSEVDSEKWGELGRLVKFRAGVRAEMLNTMWATEARVLELESEMCAQPTDSKLCDSCNLIRDPRLRKMERLRAFHQQLLENKPKQLLCTPGIHLFCMSGINSCSV